MTDKKLILIIDDEPDILVIMKFRLKKAGYETAAAHSAQEGLKLLAELRPALLLTDMNLPDMRIEEMLSVIRADARFAALPVIVLSAGGEEVRARALAAGADEYLTKPCPQERLVAELDARLAPRQA